MSRNQRLNATLTIGSVLDRSVGRHLNIVSRGLGRVNDEIGQLTSRRRDMERQRRELEKQGRSVDELDREYEQLGQTLDDLRRRQERYERAVVAASRVGHRFGEMTREVGRFARNAALGVTALGTAAFGRASSTASAADQIGRFAQLANTSPHDFQRMAIAAESVGIENEKLADILKDVNDRIGDFLQTGGGPMADFFENVAPQVGITADHFRDLSGADALQLYVQTLQDANLSQQDMTFYMEAMASDATALIPLLVDNGREMNRLADAGERVGRVLGDETIAASREFNEAMRDARGSVAGLRNIIGAQLMPVVTDAMRSFGAFMSENREGVTRFAEALATGIGDALPVVGQMARGVGRIAEQVGATTAAVAEMVGGWENFGMIVGGIFASRAILSIGAFAASVWQLGAALGALAAPTVLPAVVAGIQAISAAVMANPIGAAIGAIAFGAVLIWRNWETIGPKVRAVLERIGDGFTWLHETIVQPVAEALRTAGQGIVAAWEQVRAGLSAALEAIGAAFQRAWAIIEPIVAALKWARDNAGAIIDNIGSRSRDLYDSAPETRGDMRSRAVTINAQGMSAAEVIAELDRRRDLAMQGALYDSAASYGQYGGEYG